MVLNHYNSVGIEASSQYFSCHCIAQICCQYTRYICTKFHEFIPACGKYFAQHTQVYEAHVDTMVSLLL